jgi:hypothetical protein
VKCNVVREEAAHDEMTKCNEQAFYFKNESNWLSGNFHFLGLLQLVRKMKRTTLNTYISFVVANG